MVYLAVTNTEQWLYRLQVLTAASLDYKGGWIRVTNQGTLRVAGLTCQLQEHSAALASAPNLASLIGSSQVSPSLLLAAREDQSFIDPVKAGTSTSVYKTLMGSVPDRGGRPGEIASYASMDREELKRQQRGMRRRTIS
ncbi:unnamed protein product [Oreochromis niloticus]|nr:unnamed protein product [Mustela putorius furo]